MNKDCKCTATKKGLIIINELCIIHNKLINDTGWYEDIANELTEIAEGFGNPQSVLDRISQELLKARQEEREKMIDILYEKKSYAVGSSDFNDLIDKLIEELKSDVKKKELSEDKGDGK